MLIYVDASVLLAHLLAESRRPTPEFWQLPLTSSRLLAYETWSRVHAFGIVEQATPILGSLLSRTALMDLSPKVLARALEPFPVNLRTLDAMHLATAHFLQSRDQEVQIATYDHRMAAAARALEFELYALE